MLLVAIAGTLPILIAIATRPAMYNGIRHFVFVVPPLCVLGGLAGAYLLRRLDTAAKPAAAIAGLAILGGLAVPVIDMVRLHPYQYTHFNRIAGGVQAADDRYMLDYWGLSFKQAAAGIAQPSSTEQARTAAARAPQLAHRGVRPASARRGRARAEQFVTTWDPKGADFALMLGEFYCAELNAPVLVEIERDGVVFARVYDIRGRNVTKPVHDPAGDPLRATRCRKTLCLRRLWHAVRRACRDRAPSRSLRARCRPGVGDLAHQAARIHMDADACRAIRGFLDADRARARFRAGALSRGRHGDPKPLLDAYFGLDAFPDARACLQALKTAGRSTAILSNGSPPMLAAAGQGAGIADLLDKVLSVDAVRLYKPRPEVYALATEAFGVEPADVVFVSSNSWDVMGAVSFGFRGVWVNRAGMPEEYPERTPIQRIDGPLRLTCPNSYA